MKVKELFEEVLKESGQKSGETQEQYYERLRKQQKALRDRKKEMNKDPHLAQKLEDLKQKYNEVLSNHKYDHEIKDVGRRQEAAKEKEKELGAVRGEIQKLHNQFKKNA
jgi:Skp family chaperone for outer membrane proteins